MANRKISQFTTVTDITAVNGLAGYDATTNIQISGNALIASLQNNLYKPYGATGTVLTIDSNGVPAWEPGGSGSLQDLDSVLTQGNQSPIGGFIEMLDGLGSNPLTLTQGGLGASPASNLTVQGSGLISISNTGNNKDISMSTLSSTGTGNIIIAAKQSGGRLELESDGDLRFNFDSPAVNQILKTINTDGDVEWVDIPVVPTINTPTLDALANPTTGNDSNPAISLDDGNAGTYNVILTGGNGINVDRIDDENITIASSGLAGVLTASSSATSGQSITFTDGTNINVLSVTGFDSASTATLEVKSSGADVEVNSVSNDVILKGDGDLILENTGLGTPTSGDYLISESSTGKAVWYTDPKAFQTLSAGVSDTWAYRDGNNAVWAVGAGSVTLTITGASSGDSGTLILIVSTGEVTWPTGSLWPDATEPTLAGNGTTVVSFIYDGSDYYWSYGQNFGA